MAPRKGLLPTYRDFTITRQSVFSDRCLRKKSRPYIFVDNFTKAHPNPYFNVARTKGRQSCKERLFFRTLLHSLCEANIEIGGGGWPPQLTHGHARTAFFFSRKHRNAYVFLWTWGVGVYLAEIVSESAWTFFFLVPSGSLVASSEQALQHNIASRL